MKFIAWPNVVGTALHNTVKLGWVLTEPVNERWGGTIYFESNRPKVVCSWKVTSSGTIQTTYGKDDGINKVSLIVLFGSRSVDMIVRNLQVDDARHNYMLKIVLDGKDDVLNRQAWIVIYSKYLLYFNVVLTTIIYNS